MPAQAPARAHTSAASITTFDAPGAGTAAGRGTYGIAINDRGIIAGLYVDASKVEHGFERNADETIVSFDVSGANDTIPTAINALGDMVGEFAFDGGHKLSGFVRGAKHGVIVAFRVPGEASRGLTAPMAINKVGAITGGYSDVNSVDHGFLLSPPAAWRHSFLVPEPASLAPA